MPIPAEMAAAKMAGVAFVCRTQNGHDASVA
jgi:hypothetical protein